MKVDITVNGESTTADVEPRQLLAHYLRDTVGLKATNIGCDTTSCGACTVLLDGEAVKSCTVLSVQADQQSVTTMEGLDGASEGRPEHPVTAVPLRARLAVRVLHPGHGHVRGVADQPRRRPGRAQGAGGAGGQPLPLHRLPQHRPCGARRGRQGPGRRAEGRGRVRRAAHRARLLPR
ncbi:Carbon monoxide dehydrogenase small chain [Pseudonocardia sp. Ae168_Ps1]|nr:Carbon monoxide dehydrogenase small chain [Pseudonocardia sp. Ae150A_Ps1]OLL80509.1 Carbon monoxide dehydrogenase small chain [Pseudonocardia sp. Ae168_Ps1]OLL85363.1 Carbon monoxide dehydrogenase small chain [Pseudonocardia sp. Ae263_Ps1]OLL94610.1 Carbon monoxide dehydrogenase small chain [Pseudonocardia sp. Ae356_Ps1]